MALNNFDVVVAQNCPWFSERDSVMMSSIRDFAEGCSCCANYSEGSCTKELFEELRDRIRMN